MSRRNRNAYDEGEEKVKLSKERLKRALRVYKFIKPYNKPFIVGLFFLALSSSVFMIFPLAAGEMLNIATGKPQYGLDLNDLALVLLVVLIVQSVVSFFRILMFAIVSERGVADLRQALYEKLISLPVTFFEKRRVGELTSRSTADAQQIQDVFSFVLAEFVRQIITLIIGIGFLMFKTPQLTLVMLATFPVAIIIAMFFGRHIRKLSRQRQDELAKTTTILDETLHAVNVVKSFTNEWFEALRYGRSVENVVKIALKFARVRGLFIMFIIGVLFGAMFFVIWQGALMVQNNNMPSGDLVTFIATTAIIGGAVAGLGDLYTQLLRAVGATERIMDILDLPSEVNVPTTKNAIKANLKGDIIYENVHFTYPTREDVEVLKGVNLTIKEGETVALVGSSGAGKSTIVQLLLRFYNLNSGKIKINNKDIQDYDIAAFRKNMAIVPQEVMLFGGSIRENIAYGKPDATDEEIRIAAEQANALKFITNFPEGFDTIVGERGVKLSGGQRQRVAIARAILRDPSILILDEATSALDAESEKAVQEALNNLMKGRTSIVIAHRLATIREANCIYVLDNGEIIEQGTHEELTQIEEGVYNSLAKLQFEPVS